MIGLFPKILPRLARQLMITTLAVCIAPLGAAGVGQMLCLPDCAMHQEVGSTPSCCERDLEHAVMGAVADGSHSLPPPAPCCETTLCFDAPAASAEVAAALNSIEASIEAPPQLLHQAVPNPTASLAKFSSAPPTLSPPVPIYIRTCVYLI